MVADEPFGVLRVGGGEDGGAVRVAGFGVGAVACTDLQLPQIYSA